MTGHQAELAEHQLVAKLVAKMVAVAKAKRVVAKMVAIAVAKRVAANCKKSSTCILPHSSCPNDDNDRTIYTDRPKSVWQPGWVHRL